MISLLFWLYLINSILLINHEIDSAFWKEWDLFKLGGGIRLFLIIHFPLLFIVLYGLILLYQQTLWGLVISLFLSLSGLTAFIIHMYFIRKGYKEFNVPVSLAILYSTFTISVIQGVITLYLMT